MKLTDIPLDELERIPLFSGLRRDELERLMVTAHQKHLPGGGFYYYQGDAAERIFVLTKGLVKRTCKGASEAYVCQPGWEKIIDRGDQTHPSLRAGSHNQ
jgi:hypothetical protein